jgi:hypothetical protein
MITKVAVLWILGFILRRAKLFVQEVLGKLLNQIVFTTSVLRKANLGSACQPAQAEPNSL